MAYSWSYPRYNYSQHTYDPPYVYRSIEIRGAGIQQLGTNDFGSYTIDTTNESLALYAEIGDANFVPSSLAQYSDDTDIYFSDKARIRIKATNTGFYNVSLQYWSKAANMWAGSGEISAAFSDYTVVYYTHFIYSQNPLRAKLVMLGRRASNPALWDLIWTWSALTPDNFFTNLQASSFPDDGPEYDPGLPDDDTHDIGFPDEPKYGLLSTHMCHAYLMTESKMVTLATQLWDISSTGFIATIGKFYGSPAEAILGINIVPVVPSVPASEVQLNIGNWVSSSLTAPRILSDYVTYDCGTVTLNGNYGTYLDYTDTSVEIFLPFIGIKSLAIEDVMNSQLHLKYRFDVLTGACVACISVKKTGKGENRDVLDSVIYHFEGNAAMQSPISAADYTQRIQAVIGMISGTVNGISEIASGHIAEGSSAALSSQVSGLANAKHSYRINGHLAADTGMMGSLTPFIILTRPNARKPSSFDRDKGRSSKLTGKIGSMTDYGFTKFSDVIMTGITCTDAEKDEIYRILKEGIIL